MYLFSLKQKCYLHALFLLLYYNLPSVKFLKRFEFYEQKCFLKLVLNQLLSKARKKQELGQTGKHSERANVWLTFC